MILTEDFSRIKEIFLEALKSTRAYVREYRIRAKNGDILWVRERARIICDPQGRIVQVNGVFSERERMGPRISGRTVPSMPPFRVAKPAR
jgi:PAS domain-containing protein